MPELPEVETVRRGLERNLLGKEITEVIVKKDKMIRSVSVREFKKKLVGSSFKKVDRRGKLLIFSLSHQDTFLLAHLKMTGQLIYKSHGKVTAGGHNWPPVNDELPNKFSHIILSFADKSRLFFNDMRQFGYMQLVDKETKEQIVDKYGLEPFSPEFTWPAWRDVFKKRKTVLKAALLNQQLVAGLGNIYVDEVCYIAKVRPDRRVSELSEAELKAVYEAVVPILKKAVEHGGTTFSDYRDAEGGRGNFTKLLKVYGRGGLVCLRCNSPHLVKTKVAGRGTVYCANCQV